MVDQYKQLEIKFLKQNIGLKASVINYVWTFFLFKTNGVQLFTLIHGCIVVHQFKI